MKSSKRVVVIAPGRGTYTRQELKYLKRFKSDAAQTFLMKMDAARQAADLPGIFELDGQASFQPALHMAGEHASSLIYAAAYADYLENLPEDSEVVAVLGNSMGWYISLVCAGSLLPLDGYRVIQSMGSMMQEGLVGGQIIYPIVDENWNFDLKKYQHVESVLIDLKSASEDVAVSIYLGGYLVLAASDSGLKALLKALHPIEDRFPMRLNHHAAFHTPLMLSASERGKEMLEQDLFKAPEIPLIDGRGAIWTREATDIQALYDYTLTTQVLMPYDFTLSLEVALKEFNPDQLVLLGPGGTLGSAIGQTLVKNKWQGMKSKVDFQARQQENPFLLTLGVTYP